ncbi:MAG: heavy metal translocating P-type ATPase [Acholeplasmataceae bacterium]|nr:heavy metal translocating P-type ATPase [Acholeplasmataceae bacterium]
MNKEIMYDIKGMTCAACVSAVEKAALKTPGVLESNVSLPTEQLRVVVDMSFDESKLYKNITLTGYKASAIDKNETLSEKQSKKLKNMRIKIVLSLIFMLPLLYVSMGHMVGLGLPSIVDPMENPFGFALIQLLLTVPVMIIGYKYYVNGFKNLFRRNPNMDTLVAIGTSAAFLYGVYGLVMIGLGNHEFADILYFEVSSTILVLVMIGKYMEQLSTTKTTSELEKLMDLKPKTALLFTGNTYVETPLEQIKMNDELMVRPGDVVPTDGIIIEGITSIDESMMTGEPIPKDKTLNDEIIGGTVNITGAILMRVTHVGEDTVLSSIIRRVSEAQMKKAPIQKLADKISGVFVPIVLVLATLGFIVWLIATKDFDFSMNILVSVLVIACPCALGLATPTAIMTASGAAAKHGILIASGEALEISSKATMVVFDKTGTITVGKPTLQKVVSLTEIKEDKLLQIAASLEQQSNHPIAKSIISAAEEKGYQLSKVENFENYTGLGIKGKVAKVTYLIGNEKLMIEHKIKLGQIKTITKDYAKKGITALYLANETELVGILAISDQLKDGVIETVKKLNDLDIKTAILSGDDINTVTYIANEVGVDEFYGSLLPQDKQNIIKSLKEKYIVMMVGDGINDAIALKEANVGVSLSSGTDVAMSAGDVVLMRSDIKDIITLIDLSKHTVRNIQENLFWAFIYNVIGIPIALGILTLFGGPLLNPMIAALAMSFSSVSVVLNALRLKRYKGVKQWKLKSTV